MTYTAESLAKSKSRQAAFSSKRNGQFDDTGALTLYLSPLPKRGFSGITEPFLTRQELIPSTALASLSIGDHLSMWIPKGSEILRLYAYLGAAPVTIPEMRVDLFGLRLHRCNQLEIVKGGPPFSDT
jgi:hypothetical protein